MIAKYKELIQALCRLSPLQKTIISWSTIKLRSVLSEIGPSRQCHRAFSALHQKVLLPPLLNRLNHPFPSLLPRFNITSRISFAKITAAFPASLSFYTTTIIFPILATQIRQVQIYHHKIFPHALLINIHLFPIQTKVSRARTRDGHIDVGLKIRRISFPCSLCFRFSLPAPLNISKLLITFCDSFFFSFSRAVCLHATSPEPSFTCTVHNASTFISSQSSKIKHPISFSVCTCSSFIAYLNLSSTSLFPLEFLYRPLQVKSH